MVTATHPCSMLRWMQSVLSNLIYIQLSCKPEYKATHHFTKKQKIGGKNCLTKLNMQFSSGDCKQKEVKAILLIINSNFNTVMCIPIPRQRLDKHVLAEANGRNIRTSTARQRIIKHASLTTEAVFSAWSVQSGYKEEFSWEELVVVRSWESSVEEFIWVSCRELGRVLVMAFEGDWEEMARKELGCAKKTSCVIWSYSETLINSLSGYD
jgi:hypothetical protein